MSKAAFRQTAFALAVAAACVVAPRAHAAIFTVTGTTAGAPTFNRPLADLSGLSGIGTAVPYSVFRFTVSVAGDYTFLTTGAFDTFALLYSGTFSPSSPLTNAVIANDDLLASPFTTSGFAATLSTGTAYSYVVTGFANTDFGAFSTTIGGPGAITAVSAVPEPTTYLLLGMGLGVISLMRRRGPAAND